MHLWTDYEGNTLSGYPIGRLTRSEGRSAFFVTADEHGKPALLRLTEAHFDEGELIGRWQKTAAVSHPHLQGIRHSGKANFQGTALACCLLEPTDGSLSDVLRDRVLSYDEALEVTEAVAGALAALHAAGLVHEHVDATNVFAVGEVVKLRSDCVRECAGDFEADTDEARAALRARDVNDLGLLLRRCLTPQWQESAEAQLPAPFDSIVRRALNGTVTAQQIVAEMEARKPAPLPTPATVSVLPANSTVARTGSEPVGPIVRPSGTPAASPKSSSSTHPAQDAAGAPPSASTPVYAGLPPAGRSASARKEGSPQVAERSPFHRRARSVTGRPAPVRSVSTGLQQRFASAGFLRSRASVMGVVAALLLATLLWSMRRTTHDAAPAAQTSAASSRPASRAAADVPTVVTQQSASAAAPRSSLLASSEQAGWRVIAYTYNYEKQAAAKVQQLQRKHLAMQPQVFSPSGHAPYFVALGGPSDAVSAIALRNRARHSGLPRDTFARNF